MGLYDDIDNEVLEQNTSNNSVKTENSNNLNGGLFDDFDREIQEEYRPKSFVEQHPVIDSIPEAAKQFGSRAVKSYPEYAAGLNDLLANVGDKFGAKGLSDFGRSNYEFWKRQSDKIPINAKFQGVAGLSNPNTVLPTIAGSIGDQATNIINAVGGGAIGAGAAAKLGLSGLAKTGMTTVGTSIPNFAQEGTYLDKLETFQQINGRIPTTDEMRQIQNVALSEKAANTVLETVADKMLFGKVFPQGQVTKGVKKFLKNAGQQALTEAGTEAMQEGVSIGAEKLLGMNQGDNLARLADAMAIGGVTGGVMGGVGTAASQPLNTQFNENQSAINPVEAIQNVSAKIVDGGKVLYDSAADKLNAADSNIANATTAVGDMVSALSSFDTLRVLSKEGALSNHIENIAPNTVKKQRAKKIKNNPETVINNSPDVSVQDTGVPNMIEDTNLYNVSENGENTITNAQNVENIANEVQQETPIENTAVLEKNKKETQKVKAKAEAIEKIKQIASKTAEKIETEQKDTKEIGLKDRLKELGYNNNDVDNFFNAIENKENVDLSFGNTMFNGLLNTKEEADFIKAQELNKLTKEYRQSKKLQKNNKAAEIAPKTVEKVQNDTFRKINDEHTARIMQVYNKYTQQDILAGKANAEIEAINKEFEPLEKTALDNNHTEQPLDMVKSAAKNEKIKEIAPNIIETNKNKEELIAKAKDLGIRGNLKAMKPEKLQAKIKEAETKVEPQKHISEGWKVQDFIDDLEPQVNQIYEGNSIQKPFKNRQELKKWCMENQPYYKKYIPDVVNYFANKHNILNDFVKEESVTTKKKEEIKNGHSAEKTNGNRSNVSEREKTTETNTSEIPQGKSANERTVDEIGRGYDISNDGQRGISQKDKEVIEKEIPKTKIEQLAPKTTAKQNSNNHSETLEKDSEIVNNYEKGVENEQRRSEISEEIGRTSEEIESSENNRRSDDDNGRSGQRDIDGRRINPEHQDLIEKKYKNQHEKNKAIEKFINDKEYEKYSELPEEIKLWLKQYAGAGGLEKQGAEGKGLLTEYYTPEDIVKKMWELTSQYVNTDGSKVLEPSVGIGRFLEFAPENTTVDAVEINPVSAKITELLYPNANVTVGEFQQNFVKNNKPIKNVEQKYDIVIGNPPYGVYEGVYKGLGEGKGHLRLETYFIERGLDTLKENGVMSFIVPSSFLDSKSGAKWKQNIATKGTLLDAYRLPEKTFDTTSIGTDILVIRKETKNLIDTNMSNGEWFKKHPEKILGAVEQRKNRFGKLENVVKGEKNAVGQIDTSKKDVKETVAKDINVSHKKNTAKKSDHVADISKKVKKPAPKVKGEVEYTEYQANHQGFSEAQIQTFLDTKVDGTLPKEKYQPGENINQYNGELYNDFNYLQGDIYEKLDRLETENISKKQKEIQRKKLETVKPTPKKLQQISINPTTDFARNFETGEVVQKSYWGNGKWHEEGDRISLPDMYLEYARDLSLAERNNVPYSYIEKYVNGEKLNFDYNYPRNCVSEKERKIYREKESIRLKTQIINTVDTTFKNFTKDVLDTKLKTKLIDEWNRTNNNIYNPDYTKIPMLVKGLSSEFYGKKLKLLTAQTEGVNFLTNKGVGLLGFEVGVGKTLTGIISTVQNMQMGRCKKPLILVPKQVSKNWIAEIQEAFPNIKINDVGNLSKFSGEIEENSITVATYQALDNMWYDEKTETELIKAISEASINAKKSITKRNSEKTKEQAETVLGVAKAGNKNKFTIQQLGFDHITVDEAHNFKNLFSKAQSYDDNNNVYSDIPTGSQSKRACQLFLATQYVLQHNQNRNVFLLTATPFNNNPIEVYNMLSYTAKDVLDKMGMNNVYQFMETYANIVSDFVVDSNNNVVYKQIVNGFKNVSSLKEIIRSTMLIRTAEEAGVKRPQKKVETVKLEPTDSQLNALAEAESIALQNAEDGDVLRAINQSRQATLSPDIANNNLEVSPEDFVNNAPKIKYCCDAIATMLKKDSQTSQILYMPLGVRFLPKIKQYLVAMKVLNDDEIKIIDSSVKDEQIEDIVDSFNDREGKLKLIIGTSKIKEGMNLNKNTSVLYVPYLDWNPTDFQQVEGRLWRQGNSYKKVRVVVPLLKNSSDSFMFQKIQEKSERLNALLSKQDVDFIDMNELNTAKDKINMISAPDKKAKMFIQMEEQKIKDEKASLEGRKSTVISYKEKLSKAKNFLDGEQSRVNRLQDETEKYEGILAEKQETDEDYARYNSYLEQTKKSIKAAKNDLNSAKNKLQAILNRIKRLELDLDGKDSEEVIEQQIAKKEQEIENLREIEKIKFEEYTEQYEKERKESKTVEDYIKEFEKETDDFLARNDFDSEDFDIGRNIQSFVYKKILNANSNNLVKMLSEIGFNTPELFSDIITQIDKDYTIDTFHERKARGRHIGELKHIYVNPDLIGEDIYAFTECVFHEIEHSIQYKKYKNLLKKDVKDLTDKESVFILDYTTCHLANKNKRKFYEANKEVLDEIFENLSGKNKQEQMLYMGNLPNDDIKVYNKYREFYKKYYNCELEKKAREKGKNTKNKLREYNERRRISGRRIIANTPFNDANGYSSARGRLEKNIGEEETEESIETKGQITPSHKAAKTRKEKLKAANELDSVCDEKVKNSIRKWYASIEKDRYDVNKTLTSLINHTKYIAKQFSQKYGFKISDKMIREVMPFLRERTDIPENLNRPELIKLFKSLNNEDKARLTKLADDTSAKFEKYYKEYQILKGGLTEENIANHISHIWKKSSKDMPLLTNYFAMQSRFAKSRTIPTIFDGINGIILENGETKFYEPETLDYAKICKISSDTFIKSNADIILADYIKSLKDENGVPLVLPSSKAPSNWVEFDNPVLAKRVYLGGKQTVTLEKQTVKVHPDIANSLKTVFETYKDNAVSQIFDKTNAIYKQAQLGFSGFHVVALTESMLGNMGMAKTLKFLNPARIFNEIKKGNWNIYADETLAKQAIDDGLQFGATLDIDRKGVEKIVDNVAEITKKKIPFIGTAIGNVFDTISKAQKLNNKFLWDYLHNNYKLECYKLLCLQESKNRKLTQKDRQEIAQWVNDSFGGQVWENLGISVTRRKTEQRIFLSPDWLRSTTRQFLAMFSNGKLQLSVQRKADQNKFWKKAKEIGERWGIGSLTNDVESSNMRGKISRAFWLRSIIYSAILYNALNAMMRMWDKEKNPEFYNKNLKFSDYLIYSNSLPTDSSFDKFLPKVFIGRNKDGTEKMLRLGKQFREVPEIVENPIKKLGGKLSPNVQIASQILTGHTASGFKNYDMFEKDGKTRKNEVVSSAKLIAKSFMPFSVNQLYNKYSEPSVWSLFAPVSKGMSKYKGKNAYEKLITNGKPSDIQKLDEIMHRNGFDKKQIKQIKRSAITDFTKEYKNGYIEALKDKDYKKVKEISDKLDKANLSQAEKRKVYAAAYKKFRKDRNI